MKNYLFSLVLLFLLGSVNVFGQSFSVSGIVSDTNGEPIIGVNVMLKGAEGVGTITDLDGRYSLTVSNSKSVLVYSFIGYTTANETVGTRKQINKTLVEDAKALEEVVVVGYGTQRKVTLTGSVATVKGDDLKSSPTTNLTNGMLGRLPGVIGWQRGDEPGGGGTTIRIRGTNSLGNNDPLIVIDGVAGREGGLDRLNPNEIESISVLKDASAAIYGARAANGVILVTTKRGKEGKPSVTYTGNIGFSTATRLPEMCNSFEYATLINEVNKYRNQDPSYLPEDLKAYQEGSDAWKYPNTNWFDEALKSVSPMYRHDVSVSGGSDKFKFYLNLAANGEDGIYKNSANRYDQYSIRANIDAQINKYIKLSYGNVSRMEYRQFPTKSAGDIFSALVRSKPNQPAYWPSGEPGPDIENGDNPIMMGTDGTGYDREKSYYIQNNLKLEIKIPGVEGLSLVGNASYDKYFKMRKKFSTPWTLYSWDGNEEHTLTPGKKGPATPELSQEHTDQTDWMLNAVINYDRTFGAHTVGVTVGTEAQYSQQDYLDAFRKNYISDKLDEINAGGLEDLKNGGRSWEKARLNFFGRVSYNYLERYLVEFIFRYDGSYLFPKKDRFGFFPGVSAAWRVSEEDFWKKNVTFIDYFKLRASVSQTGSDAIGAGQYLNTFNGGTDYMFGTTFNKTLYPSRTPNSNITWEVGTTYNVGLDFKFLQNRLAWESDVFLHRRTHMLIHRNASLPETSGISLPDENLGRMSNRGFETMLTWADRAGKVDYNASFNLSYAKNKIEYWDETPGAPSYQQSTGYSTGCNLYYVADGVFNTQEELDNYPHWNGARLGDIKFKDIDGDESITANDRVRSDKNSEPRWVAGLNLGARWNNFDIMAFFQAAFGAETYIWTNRAGLAGNYYRDAYLHRWTEENPMVEHPRTYNRTDEYWMSNSNTYFLHKTDYLRLKNLELGYTFNMESIRNSGISNLRLFVNATNLFTIDNVKVQDPESNDSGSNYPQRRVMNFGASITF